MAVLAALSKAVLVPVTSRRLDPNEVAVRIHPPISAQNGSVRDIASHQATMQGLFDCLAKQVRQCPEQWESWRYLHRLAVRRPDDKQLSPAAKDFSPHTLKLNNRRYTVLSDGSRYWLFDKAVYRSWPISAGTFSWFKEDCGRHSQSVVSPPAKVLDRLIGLNAVVQDVCPTGA